VAESFSIKKFGETLADSEKSRTFAAAFEKQTISKIISKKSRQKFGGSK
jgi:hypothetical protein